MKGKLEFDLPGEQAEFLEAVEGPQWKALCEHVFSTIRAMEKHENMSESEEDRIARVRDVMLNYMQDRGLELY